MVPQHSDGRSCVDSGRHAVTDEERRKLFEEEVRRQLRRLPRLQAETAREIIARLQEAERRIVSSLANSPSEFEAWRLKQLQAEVRQVLASAETAIAASLDGGLVKSWGAGIDLIDLPLAAASLRVASVAVPDRVLAAMRSFVTDRIKDLSTTLVNKVNGELAQALIGTQSPWATAGKIKDHLRSGGMKRALVITRTEMGRAYSVAAQARSEQAVERLPGLKKQWRKSGKKHPRITHELADGQIRAVAEPYLVGGAKLMHPKDPSGPAKETVNCGCTSLPYMAHWNVSHPLDRPMTPEEANATAARRRSRDVRDADYRQWVEKLTNREVNPDGTTRLSPLIHADGTQKAIARIPDWVKADLAAQGIKPLSLDVLVSDNAIRHMSRDAKGSKALPQSVVMTLPDIIEGGRVYLDVQKRNTDGWKTEPKTLHFVSPVPGRDQVVRVTVRLDANDDRGKHQGASMIVSASMVTARSLDNDTVYKQLVRQ